MIFVTIKPPTTIFVLIPVQLTKSVVDWSTNVDWLTGGLQEDIICTLLLAKVETVNITVVTGSGTAVA